MSFIYYPIRGLTSTRTVKWSGRKACEATMLWASTLPQEMKSSAMCAHTKLYLFGTSFRFSWKKAKRIIGVFFHGVWSHQNAFCLHRASHRADTPARRRQRDIERHDLWREKNFWLMVKVLITFRVKFHFFSRDTSKKTFLTFATFVSILVAKTQFVLASLFFVGVKRLWICGAYFKSRRKSLLEKYFS